MTDIAPIHREILLRADPATAFTEFTAHLGSWWPLASHSVFGPGATVAFEDDRIVERLGDQESVWGTVTTWDSPHTVAFSWHPGVGEERATDVSVTFCEHDGQTLVTLVHSGWERLDGAQDLMRGYEEDWPVVLAAFAAREPATS